MIIYSDYVHDLSINNLVYKMSLSFFLMWQHSFTNYILNIQVCTGRVRVTSYLIEGTYRHIGVDAVLCTNVRSGQTVALRINLLAKAQSAHLDGSRRSWLQLR